MMHDMPHDDHEAAMAKSELYRAAKYAMKLFEMIQEGDELEGWVQGKVTKASDYLASVYHYLEYEMKFKHPQGDTGMDMVAPMGGDHEEEMAFAKTFEATLASKLEAALLEEKHAKIVQEAKKKDITGDGKNNFDDVQAARRMASGQSKKAAVKAATSDKLKESDKGDMDHDGKDEPDSSEWKQNRDAAIKKSQANAKDKKVKETSIYANEAEDRPAAKKKETTWTDKSGKKHPATRVQGSKSVAADKDADKERKDLDKIKEGSKEDHDYYFGKDKPDSGGSKSKELSKHTATKSAHGTQYTKRDLPGQDTADDADEKARKRKAKKMGEASHQAKTTMKHVKNPTAGEKAAAKDIKPGVKGYSDRVAMLKSAEKDGRLKEAAKNLKQQAAIAIAKKKSGKTESINESREFLDLKKLAGL